MPKTPRDPETITRVKRDATERLLAIPNVVAVGIGPKMVGGRATGEPAIRVFVRRKLPADQVPADELIPPTIDGVLTDVDIGGDPVPVADPVPVDRPGAIHPLTLDLDETTYRPVVGGGQLTTVGSNHHGTLGCLMWDPANHEVAYALTNMHVIQPPDITAVTKNTTKIGQPDGSDSSSKCCNDVIGVWVGGGQSAERDEALVRLSPGMKWKAQITEIGLVAGKHKLIQTDVTGATPYKVAKRGMRTRLTGGTVSALSATTSEADNLIIIKPTPNPGAGAGDVTFFDFEGDSGSALVNAANEVVGLIWARDDVGNGYAYHIDHVLARLKNTDGLTVEVASSTDPNEVHTVPGATFVPVPHEVAERVAADPAERLAFTGADGRAPLGSPWFSDVPPVAATAPRVFADLAASESGQLLLDVWQTHREELTRLVDRDRRVTVAWHRGGGAALSQLLLRLPADPGRALPATLYDEPLMTSVDRLHVVLVRSASEQLRADLDRVRAVLPDLDGLTYAQIVAALGARELIVDG
jgi:hypothetical protein